MNFFFTKQANFLYLYIYTTSRMLQFKFIIRHQSGYDCLSNRRIAGIFTIQTVTASESVWLILEPATYQQAVCHIAAPARMPVSSQRK